jgi:hypothetical protein
MKSEVKGTASSKRLGNTAVENTEKVGAALMIRMYSQNCGGACVNGMQS